jgi:hypothetical protein
MTTFDRELYSSGVGNYTLTKEGRRLLLSKREADIRELEEIAFLKADAKEVAHYLVSDWDGRLFITDDPHGFTIVRVCPYLKSKNTKQ